ncbi:MAG: PqiC family protein [Gammaproteobacteria bacterium]|nr:PqiC family protein [Gammaproteobacteria bacterium]
MKTRMPMIALSLAAVLGVAACASTKPTSFFLLQPITATTGGEAVADHARARVLGIGPVELPGHLDRPQIVTRGTGNRLEVAEFSRWAEPLQENVTRVLGENLATFLPGDRIASFPWTSAGAIDYQVTVEISRFDGVVGDDSTLTARWQVLAPATGDIVMTRNTNVSVPSESADHGGTVAAMNQALDALSREIGEGLRSILLAGIPRNDARRTPNTPGS